MAAEIAIGAAPRPRRRPPARTPVRPPQTREEALAGLAAHHDQLEDDAVERLVAACRALHAADLGSDAYHTAALRICDAVDDLGGLW